MDTKTPHPGPFIRARLKDLGMTQEELARAADMTLAGLNRIICQRNAMVRLDTIQRIATALSTTVGALLGEDEG